MNISLSESNYIAFGNVGMNFEWSITDEPIQSILEAAIVSEYAIGENYFAELTGCYSTMKGCPVAQFLSSRESLLGTSK